MRPTFLLPGIGKCGTSTLAHLLGLHPEITMANIKEPDFLSFDHVYEQGWAWYEQQFETTSSTKAIGEASVSYHSIAHEAKTYARIAEHLPNVKVIILARNPTKRLESVFREAHDNGHMSGVHVSNDLAKAMKQHPFMVEETKYFSRTEVLRSTLPTENILYLCLEDLQNQQSDTLRRCLEFLQVNPDLELADEQTELNKGSGKQYDTWVARVVRQNAALATTYRTLVQPLFNDKMQQALIKLIRRDFANKEIVWQPKFRAHFIETMRPEVQAYLKLCDKPSDFWGSEFV